MKSMTMFVVLTVMILLTSGSVVRTEVEQAHNDSVNDLDRYTFTIYRGVQKISRKEKRNLKYFLMESFYMAAYLSKKCLFAKKI